MAAEASTRDPLLAAAIANTVQNHMLINDCTTARIARGAMHLGRVPSCTYSSIIWWRPGSRRLTTIAENDTAQIQLAELIGLAWRTACVIQLIWLNNAAGANINDAIRRHEL